MATPRTRFGPTGQRWLLTGVIVGVAVLALNAYLPYRTLDWVEEAERVAEQRQSAITMATALLSTLKDMETGERGYLITGEPIFLEPYNKGLAEYPPLLERLEALLAQSTRREYAAQLRPAVADVVLVQARVVEARRRGDVAAATQIVQRGEGKRTSDRVRYLISDLIATEETEVQALLEEQQRREAALRAWLTALGALDLFVFGAVFFFAFRQLRERAAAQGQLEDAGRKLERSVKSLELANARGRLLARMDDALQSCASTDEALAVIPKFCAQLLEGYPGVVYFMQPSRDLLEPCAQWGGDGAPAEPLEPDECLALRRGQAILLADPALQAVCAHVERQPGGAAPRLCVPMSAHGEVIGLMSFDLAPCRGAMPETDRKLAASIAEQISLSLANLRLREQLRRQSIVDSLTGLHNRRYLDETLPRELARAERKGQPVAVVLLDVDHFKRWNDTHGHDAGDHVLRLVGDVLQQGVRGSDIACRYGGEEFVLVMPEASLEIARERAEALRQAIAAIEVNYGGQILQRLTASFGVAAMPLHGSAPDELLQAADGALYGAKQSGRNRVVVAEPRSAVAAAEQA